MSEPASEDRRRRVRVLRERLFNGVKWDEAIDIAAEALRLLDDADEEARELAKLRQHYPAHELALNTLSANVTKERLLTADEIIEAAATYEPPCGIYFLIYGQEIVYVGQSVNVISRMSEHARRIKFSRYAFAPFPAKHLDLVESLYIHLLRPRLNGYEAPNGFRDHCAPHPLQKLLDMALTA
jgi:alkanesulfonate monooxygenase SsuD/methylene tetrahydromethanopterin reductase-like flavin-dependent oxidoreductase (luciferase family)